MGRSRHMRLRLIKGPLETITRIEWPSSLTFLSRSTVLIGKRLHILGYLTGMEGWTVLISSGITSMCMCLKKKGNFMIYLASQKECKWHYGRASINVKEILMSIPVMESLTVQDLVPLSPSSMEISSL